MKQTQPQVISMCMQLHNNYGCAYTCLRVFGTLAVLYSGSCLMGGKSAYFEMKGRGGKTINILYRIPFIKVQGGNISKGGPIPCPPKYSPVYSQ